MVIRNIHQVKNLCGKRVLLRADFNVPIKKGKVADTFKIEKSLPTIEYLQKEGAKVILMSHLGRPEKAEKKFSLEPVRRYLSEAMNAVFPLVKVGKTKDFLAIKQAIEKMGNGEIIMLENIRFFADEEKNTGTLAEDLAGLGDLFVLDGFAVSHRASASVSGIAQYLPSYAGLLLAEEIKILSRAMSKPKRPLVVILGGAKVETKIPIIKNILPIADYVLVSGGIANTYWWAKGCKLGGSLIGKEYKDEILKYCRGKKVILPIDAVVGDKDGRHAQVVPADQLCIRNSNLSVYDIGPETIKLFSTYIRKAETLIWNGALGMFEQHPYEFGTKAVAQLFASRSKGRTLGICGGGETVEIIQKFGLINDIDLVSTGGGAMLEFLSGKQLPGLVAVSGVKMKRVGYKQGTKC